MRVYIIDGNRHLQATGYGQLSRSIIRALSQIDGVEVCVEKREQKWDDIPFKEEFDDIPDNIRLKSCDVALSIRPPDNFKHSGIPTAVYTQNALGTMPTQWIKNLKRADAIIVPGQFDKDIFDKHFNNVTICPQHVDTRVFKLQPRYREEGQKEFTFLYIGSWSYRKGCDLIMPAATKAFAGDLDTRIHLQCFSGFDKATSSNLFEQLSRSGPGPVVSTYFGSLNPSWIYRIINRADAVFTLSRGEGWCMPLYEALLCRKPIIAPNSTAMGEWLPQNGVRRVKTHKTMINTVNAEFSKPLKNIYDVPGNYFWEPDENDTISAFKDVKENYAEYQAATAQARTEIEGKFSLQNIGENILATLKSII